MEDLKDLHEMKTERINGKEVRQSTASIPHIEIQGNLYIILRNFLKGKRCKVFAEARVIFDDKNWFQPDLIVVCDKSKIKANHIEGAPDFVAEILSISTEGRDFGIKKDIYEKYGVKEYWLINPRAKSIQVYLWKNGKYEIDNVYHDATEEELEGFSPEELERHKLTLKLSLYDDLEIRVKDIFEE